MAIKAIVHQRKAVERPLTGSSEVPQESKKGRRRRNRAKAESQCQSTQAVISQMMSVATRVGLIVMPTCVQSRSESIRLRSVIERELQARAVSRWRVAASTGVDRNLRLLIGPVSASRRRSLQPSRKKQESKAVYRIQSVSGFWASGEDPHLPDNRDAKMDGYARTIDAFCVSQSDRKQQPRSHTTLSLGLRGPHPQQRVGSEGWTSEQRQR